MQRENELENALKSKGKSRSRPENATSEDRGQDRRRSAPGAGSRVALREAQAREK